MASTIDNRPHSYALASRVLYAGKHFSKLHAYALLAGTLTVEFAMRLARGMLTLRGSTIAETLRAYRLLLGQTPALVRQID